MKEKMFSLAAAVLFVIAAAVSWSDGFDWPRWRGPDGDGISKETDWDPGALEGGGQVLWKVNVGIGYSNVAVSGNRVFAMGSKGGNIVVNCLDADTGQKLWEHSWLEYLTPQSTPTVEDSRVYVLSADGLVFCLEAADGKVTWKKDLVRDHGALRPAYGFGGSPVVEGSLLLLNANTSGMALDKKTGKLVWSSQKPPERIRASIPGDNGATYMTPVVFSDGQNRSALFYSWKGLFSVDPASGKPFWAYPWEIYNNSKTPDPAISAGGILLADETTKDGTRVCTLLGLKDGAPRVVWRSKEFYSDVASPVIIGGFAYCCHGGPYSNSLFARLCCIDMKTGRLAWETDLGGEARPRWISLTASDGKLIILDDIGVLRIARAAPSSYEELSRMNVLGESKRPRIFPTPPVLSGGRIYCRNYAGDLICVDVRRRQ
jgi:outer membrane protein assembly factor BamB